MKNKKDILKFMFAGLLVLGSVTSCKKEYLDINQNPNDPNDVGIIQLLPSSEGAIAHAVGNNIQIFGGLWGQYWTQSPSSSQYKTIEQYAPAANDFDTPWRILYADALQDLKAIVTKATAENKMNYVACAKILQAYTFQLLTDNWGDIPFTEACRADEFIFSPHYDSQQTVYDGIINLLSEADGMIDENADVVPGSEDLIFGGDMSLWREFGNTLKLRVYLRLAYVDPEKAAAGIAALDSAGAGFLNQGEDAKVSFISDPGNTNPLYSSIIGLSSTQNLVASSTGINYLVNHNDPRIDAFYTGSDGIPQGAYDLPAGTTVSYPGTLTGGYGDDPASAEAPVRFMSGYESLFLQAEAVARGWLSGNDQDLYLAGIAESFAAYGIDSAGYLSDSTLNYPTTTTEDKIKAIITQKWAALNGNEATEGWTEWRRTGYPDFFTESTNSIIGSGRMPQRFFYPSAEVTRNFNFPGQKLIYDKVWWDVN